MVNGSSLLGENCGADYQDVVWYGVNTIIGPIELLYSWNPDNNQNHWYINVGFWF